MQQGESLAAPLGVVGVTSSVEVETWTSDGEHLILWIGHLKLGPVFVGHATSQTC